MIREHCDSLSVANKRIKGWSVWTSLENIIFLQVYKKDFSLEDLKKIDWGLAVLVLSTVFNLLLRCLAGKRSQETSFANPKNSNFNTLL